MYRPIFFLAFFWWMCHPGYSQYKVSGHITSETNDNLFIYHVVLLTEKEGSLITGGVFDQPFFQLEWNEPTKGIIRISHVGYKDFFSQIDFSKEKTISLGEVVLVPATLDEVTIEASRKLYSSDGSKIKVNVSSTYLKDLGTAIDVLKHAPGVITDHSGNITVFGRGAPLIIVDGRELRSREELDVILSSEIVSITVDRNPAARYSADVNAVILIEKKKPDQDLLNFEVLNRSFLARKTSNVTILNLNHRKGRFTNYFSYQFSGRNMKVFFDDVTENQGQTFPMTNISNSDHDHGINSHTLILGNRLDIDSLKYLTFQYNLFSQKHRHSVFDNQSFIRPDQSILINEVNRNMTKDDTRHVFTSFYSHTLPRLGIMNLTFDYSNSNRNEPVNIFEFNRTSETARNLELLNNSSNHIVSLNSGFDFNPLGKFKNSLGFRYVQLNNQGDTRLWDVSDNVVLNAESNRINESVGAMYYILSADFEQLTTQIGLRGELTHSKIKLNEGIAIDTVYQELYPSAMVGYTFSDNFSLNLDYARKINRPAFSQINPNYIYADSLTYRIGNPSLKPTISDLFSASFSLPWSLFFVADYEIMKNYISIAFFNDEDVPGRIKITHVNIPESEVFGLNLFSSYRGKKLTVNSGAGIDFPVLNIPYLDNEIQIRKPVWYFRSSVNYQVHERVSVYGNFFYQSNGSQQLFEYRQFYTLNMGISARLLSNRLNVSIEANDVLNTYDLRWKSKYGHILYTQTADYDIRMLRFTLRYNFGNFRNIFRDNSAIKEEIQRI
jgi:outer membrane receptor protein involved in Fe transport